MKICYHDNHICNQGYKTLFCVLNFNGKTTVSLIKYYNKKYLLVKVLATCHHSNHNKFLHKGNKTTIELFKKFNINIAIFIKPKIICFFFIFCQLVPYKLNQSLVSQQPVSSHIATSLWSHSNHSSQLIKQNSMQVVVFK